MRVVPAGDQLVDNLFGHKKLGSGISKNGLLFHRLVNRFQRRYMLVLLRTVASGRGLSRSGRGFVAIFNTC